MPTHCLDLSPVGKEPLDLKQKEICGKDIQEILPLDKMSQYPIISDLINQALDCNRLSCFFYDDLMLTRRDVKRIMIDTVAAPICREVNMIVGTVLMIRNFTARKKGEIELTELGNLLNGLLMGWEKEFMGMNVNCSATKQIGYELEISSRTFREAHL